MVEKQKGRDFRVEVSSFCSNVYEASNDNPNFSLLQTFLNTQKEGERASKLTAEPLLEKKVAQNRDDGKRKITIGRKYLQWLCGSDKIILIITCQNNARLGKQKYIMGQICRNAETQNLKSNADVGDGIVGGLPYHAMIVRLQYVIYCNLFFPPEAVPRAVNMELPSMHV